MIRVLITGENSYIGNSFIQFVKQFNDIEVATLNVKDSTWEGFDFSTYDSVYHVAGIAHLNEKKVNPTLYYDVNYKLTSKIARKAKEAGVKQFIYLSSMSVFGKDTGEINQETKLNPKTYYGKSKLKAEQALMELEDDVFKIVILRPPMVYGKGCKGNFKSIEQYVMKIPIFIKCKNRRSVLYVDNLSHLTYEIIINNYCGLFHPKDARDSTTTELVEKASAFIGKKLIVIPVWYTPIKSISKHVALLRKIFCDLYYNIEDDVERKDNEK